MDGKMNVKKGRSKLRADGSPIRAQDPQGTRQNILDIASQEFALNGLTGARVDEIASRTRSSKRMIYYYFGDKEGLYVSALENAYRRVREGEAKLDIEGLPPIEALTRLVEFTFDHHHQHEEFIRMVMIENPSRPNSAVQSNTGPQRTALINRPYLARAWKMVFRRYWIPCISWR